MEQQVQYTRTADGVSIAYFTMGAGPGFVWMDLPYSNLRAEWADPSTRASYELNASVSTFVRFDHRGMGLSDRGATDFSLDKMVLDLEAVVDRVELGQFALCAWRGINSPIAVAYAARHPERLTHLVLAQGAARMPRGTFAAINGLLGLSPNWRTVTESIARMTQGWDNDESSRSLSVILQESFEPEDFARFWQAAAEWDVRDLLAEIATPTLLFHWKDHPFFGPEHGRELASGIRNARAVTIDGATTVERDIQYQSAFRSFFGVGVPDAAGRAASGDGGIAIILFADIADSAGLTERLGDTTFRDRARALDTSLRGIIAAAGGTTIDAKTLGDGVLATFPAASQGIDAAVRCAASGAELGLPLHVGLHAGDVIREEGNVFGGAVNIAARICSLSASGEVLVSDIVRGLARTSAGVAFEDRGEHALKGIADTVRVYAVRAGDP
jgi:class 3 adenylate cyclase